MSDFINHTQLDRASAESFDAGTVQWTRRTGDGDRSGLSSGFWFVTPEDAPDAMRVVAHADETVYILEGHLRIEPEGRESFELTPGSVASFNKGTSALWTVLAPTVEFFVYS